MKQPLYRLLASKLQAFLNCQTRNPVNQEWADRHETTIDRLCKDFLPSGSGIDPGTKLDWDQSTPEKLVFNTAFHHMNEGGMYDGWSEHKVIVSPSLCSEFDLKITGRDRNGIKDYLGEVFNSALSEEIDHDETGYFSPALRAAQAEFKAKVASGEIV